MIIVKDLSENISYLNDILNDLERITRKEGGVEGIRKIYAEKAKQMISKKIKGVLFIEKQKTIAAAWTEKVSPNYGSIVCHHLGEKIP